MSHPWLGDLVAHAYAHAPATRSILDDGRLEPDDITSLDDLQKLPILRKDALLDLQREKPPFGGFLGIPEDKLVRVFMSPGPLFDPQGPESDYWHFGQALEAAGFADTDIVLNAAAYHFTPLGFMFDDAARAVGCRVIPTGVGNTELQVTAAKALQATAYCGTPSFLKIILEKAMELTTDLALERAFVGGEMLPESLRGSIQSLGVSVRQGYGTADLGCLGYECSELSGFHVPDAAIVEIVDPASGRPVPVGASGEVVATVNNKTYPLLRFGTGDLSVLDESACRCGRTSPRLLGILGRVGDAVKVRGMFVHPRQLDDVIRRFAEVQRYRATVDQVDGRDVFVISLEVVDESASLKDRLADVARDVLHVRPDIELVQAGSIGDDEKKLQDRRTWK